MGLLSVHRLEALTDGVFAIAMTILVLNIAVPPDPGGLTEAGLWQTLTHLRHHLINYAVSFLLLGFFWMIHHQQMHFIKRTDRVHLPLNLIGLLFICLVPFSASLMSEYHYLVSAAAVFEANILIIGLLFLAQWNYAVRDRRLIDPDTGPELIRRGRLINLIMPGLSILAGLIALANPHLHLLAFLGLPLLASVLRKRLFLTD